MKFTRNIAVALATLAFGAVPAVALASGGGNSNNAPGHTKSTSSTSSTSNTSNASKRKAWGKLCQGTPKTRPAGVTTGKTQFALCVMDMAQAAKNSKESAKTVCANQTKTHKSGQKGTDYSICVKGVAKMRSSKP